MPAAPMESYSMALDTWKDASLARPMIADAQLLALLGLDYPGADIPDWVMTKLEPLVTTDGVTVRVQDGAGVRAGERMAEAKTPYPPDSSIWEPNGPDPDTCPVPACGLDGMHGNAHAAASIFKIRQDAQSRFP